MTYRLGVYFLSLFTLFGCVVAVVPQTERLDPLEIVDEAAIKPIAITNVAAKMRRGTVLGTIASDELCVTKSDLKWRSGGTVSLSSEELVDVFREELEANGWPVVGSTDDLFSGYDVSGAEVLVAAKIIDMKSNMCFPKSKYGNYSSALGSLSMEVEWQVYSPARKSLIGSIKTKGSTVLKKSTDDASYQLLNDSFSVAANNLLANPEFYKLVAKSSGLARAPSSKGNTLIDNKKVNYQSLKSAISAAKKSTVTVRTASGHGSGFAIGDGSYILTNSHVVGDAKNVTLITRGGINVGGKVLKVSKGRDVALIRIDGIRLPSLYVDTRIPDAAAIVYAVGSPLSEELSGSVTSGIVSGNRIMDGYDWIQSDVAISSGNSGGPLLNDDGHVVGISTAGFQVSGSQVGLNLFIPITDALAYSDLRVK
jgi:S1-C subfamily serine protease